MKSWRRYIPALSLALAVTAFVSALLNHQRDRDIFVVGEPTPLFATRPRVIPAVESPSAPRPRAAGLTALTVTTPDRILMVEQRTKLEAHLKKIKLRLNVPDAMSFAATERANVAILSAASSTNTGFFVFSAKGGRLNSASSARKFLVDFFKDAYQITPDPRDESFLSRGVGEMTWIKGSAAGGQRFDAFWFKIKTSGFSHLFFILDPTVANATRRLMVDSIRAI